MVGSKVFYSSLLLLLLLLLTTHGDDVVMKMETNRRCRSELVAFRGQCTMDQMCATACVNEGFLGGNCRGLLRRRCLCSSPCA